MNSLQIQGQAPAKINLHLRVLNRRTDGYHNIFSVMAELGLSDILKLNDCAASPASAGVEVKIGISGGKYAGVISELDAGNNLVSIGVRNYLSRIKAGGRFAFELEKNIPSGAGLGGGSSDGACAIELARLALKRDKDECYYGAASATGSDVPYFLYGGCAFVTGTGDMVEPFDYKCTYTVILVNNGVHIDTGSAYKALGRTAAGGMDDLMLMEEKARIKEAIKDIAAWKDAFINDFEKAIFPLYPEISRLKDEMYHLGADFSAMTGSGSTVFGVFSDSNRALEALSILEKSNRVILTKFARRSN